MLMRFNAMIAPVVLALAVVSPAAADKSDVKPLDEFDVSQYENGWSADAMLGTEVFGEDDERIGQLENLIITAEGQIDRVIIHTDNWLDIGDRMISVPWDKVDTTPNKDGIVARVDESHMDDFSLFSGDDVQTGLQSFRATEVLGDYVSLEDHDRYGYVNDLIFDQKGRLQATAVSTDILYGDDDYQGGYYAYPFYGYDSEFGLDSDSDVYALPYNQQEVSEFGAFEYEAFEDATP